MDSDHLIFQSQNHLRSETHCTRSKSNEKKLRTWSFESVEGPGPSALGPGPSVAGRGGLDDGDVEGASGVVGARAGT